MPRRKRHCRVLVPAEGAPICPYGVSTEPGNHLTLQRPEAIETKMVVPLTITRSSVTAGISLVPPR